MIVEHVPDAGHAYRRAVVDPPTAEEYARDPFADAVFARTYRLEEHPRDTMGAKVPESHRGPTFDRWYARLLVAFFLERLDEPVRIVSGTWREGEDVTGPQPLVGLSDVERLLDGGVPPPEVYRRVQWSEEHAGRPTLIRTALVDVYRPAP